MYYHDRRLRLPQTGFGVVVASLACTAPPMTSSNPVDRSIGTCPHPTKQVTKHFQICYVPATSAIYFALASAWFLGLSWLSCSWLLVSPSTSTSLQFLLHLHASTRSFHPMVILDRPVRLKLSQFAIGIEQLSSPSILHVRVLSCQRLTKHSLWLRL